MLPNDLSILPVPAGPHLPDLITPQRDSEVEEYTPPQQQEFREFGDSETTRRLLFENTLAAARAIEPVSNSRYTLGLADVGYHGPENFSIAEQKKAILSRGSLARPLRGTWVLSDADGNEVGRKKSTLAKVPWMTNRGTFVMNGSEYTMSQQMRLRPGVFTRVKDNGELESHVNVSKGFGHRIFLDPKTGVFRISMGQARMPLIPLLRAQGVTDAMLRDAWGNDLTYANALKDDPSTIKKLHGKLYGNKEGSGLDQKAAVVEAFAAMELDPEVTKQTLGEAFSNVGPETLLAITRKLLAVGRGEADSDDRDAMAYQHMVGPEDMFAERLKKAKGVAMRLLWKSSGQGNLNRVTAGAYEDVMRGALLHSGLGLALEEINPADIFDQQSRVTRMGEGGISSLDAVPAAARALQPTQFGFIDFLRTPESAKAGVDARIARAARKGKDGRIYTSVIDRQGQTVYKSPQDMVDSVVAFPNSMKSGEQLVPALVKGKVRMMPRQKVDYEVPDMESTFSPLGNMIPLKSMMKGQRAVMATRMLTQALPLVDAEAPLVQSGIPGQPGRSFEEEYAKQMGAVRADAAGRVVAVEPDSIRTVGIDGKETEVPLYDNFPYNRKTRLHNTPTVKVGDTVQEGQLLATSNYTDKQGVTALGKNARVAYIPFEGLNFEDANVVSESFAKRMSSEHLYQHGYEWDKKDNRGRDAFLSIFPAKYDRKTLDKFDDSGSIKPGTEVTFGDPLVLIARERERNRKSLLRGRSPGYTDETITWDHHSTGTVTDVVDSGTGVAVVVNATAPMEVGDKLSGRYGGKGIVAKIFPDAEMPRDIEGQPYEVLLNPLGIISRCYDENTEFLTERGWVFGRHIGDDDRFVCYHVWTHRLFVFDQLTPFYAAHHRGEMLKFQNTEMDFCVTPNHRMWTACSHPDSRWHEATAEQIANREGWRVPVAGKAVPGIDEDVILLQSNQHSVGASPDCDEIVINADDWADFLGGYVAEQSETVPDNCRRIEIFLNRLPFSRHYQESSIQFQNATKRLYAYLKPLGICHAVGVPEWIYRQTPETRQRFIDAYLRDDGDSVRAGSRGLVHWHVCAVAEKLAHDLQRLFIYQGYSASVMQQPEGTWQVDIRDKRHCVLEQQNWEVVDYDSNVYCPTVPTGYVVTRRNGKVLIAGNTNPAQIVEAALGKIAAHRGEAFKVPDFQDEEDLVEFALKELRKAGLKDTESIVDAATDQRIDNVFTGNRWFMKLHHTAASKGQGRGIGGYTADQTPAKGGKEGAKRVGMLELGALLSHGATEFIRGGNMIRGQASPEYWAQYMSGNKPPTPKIPYMYQKYVASLKASGINVVRQGTKTHIMALRDSDIDRLAGSRELRNVETVNWKTMEPIKGGLFDRTLTGGHGTSEGGGNRWSYIKLQEPLPNPVMEEPIRRILGLTKPQLADVISGKKDINGATGPAAIADALRAINLDKEIARARAEIKSGKKTARDTAVRRLGYLRDAKRLDIHPRDWVLSKVPVLPPAFRPVSTLGKAKLPLVADPNYLYKEVWDANKNLTEAAGLLGDEDLGSERLALYDAFKAVTGLGDPTHPKNQERKVKGILRHVFGSSPKMGMVQRQLLSSTVDMVGRSVIAPDPDLDMDQVGIPEEQAWSIYRPIITRRLVRKGWSRREAARAAEERQPAAREVLLKEMEDGVVVINRAPTLHRYGMMAARPRLVKGNVLKVSPLVIGGFNADFDGDAMQYHVPTTDAERQEAIEKMLPSRNLLSAADFGVHFLPSQEYVGGLYEASARVDEGKKPAVFATATDAVRAYKQGRIGIGRKIEILED